jgi:hypothetical protein
MAPNIRLWKREAEPEPVDEEPGPAEIATTLATKIFNHKHHKLTTTEAADIGELNFQYGKWKIGEQDEEENT